MKELIGTQILHAWADKDRQGWFEGRVHGHNVNTSVDILRVLPQPILLCDTPKLVTTQLARLCASLPTISGQPVS